VNGFPIEQDFTLPFSSLKRNVFFHLLLILQFQSAIIRQSWTVRTGEKAGQSEYDSLDWTSMPGCSETIADWIGRREHDSKDRTARTKRDLEKNAGAGQLRKDNWERKSVQDSRGRQFRLDRKNKKDRTGRPDIKAWTFQLEHDKQNETTVADSHDSTVGTGHLGHENRSDSGMGQPGQVSLYRSTWHCSLDRTESTGRPGYDSDSKEKTGGTRELGTRVLEQDSWDRTTGETVRKEQSGKNSQERKQNTGRSEHDS
jgi:hypothetical protein